MAPCYRTRLTVEPSEIVEWQLFHVPELDDEAVLAAMTGDAQQIAHEFPRGDAILEDLSPEPIGEAIPNGRRLVAAIIDQAGPVARLPAHGTAHWARVAARALRLHPNADVNPGSQPARAARRSGVIAVDMLFSTNPESLDLLGFSARRKRFAPF